MLEAQTGVLTGVRRKVVDWFNRHSQRKLCRFYGCDAGLCCLPLHHCIHCDAVGEDFIYKWEADT
jgi:hypothetical protein